MGGPETLKPSAERSTEVQEVAKERSKELLKGSVEKSVENKSERIDKARAEAKEVIASKERGSAESKSGGEPTGSAVRKVTGIEKKAEYKKTMQSIQSKMNAPSRTFSRIIHNPVIEKTSEVTGKYIAGPNAILFGSSMALILTAAVYIIAKNYGYPLSGFETIATFAIGWSIGLLVDIFRQRRIK